MISSRKLHLFDVEYDVDSTICWHRFFSNSLCEIFVSDFSNVWSSILIFKCVFHSFFSEWNSKNLIRCMIFSKFDFFWKFYYFQLLQRRIFLLWFRFFRCQYSWADMWTLAKFFFSFSFDFFKKRYMKNIVNSSAFWYIYTINLIFYNFEYFEWFEMLRACLRSRLGSYLISGSPYGD